MFYKLKNLVPQGLKNIYHLAQAMLANFLDGFPSKSLKVVGVTGTDGKTTTTQMIAKILEEAGHKTAMISTIGFKLGEKEWKNLSHFTTQSSFAIQKFILDAVKARCEYLVLETSSHSLDQHRVWGINYHTAIITNVTREHLDYHRTMEKYRQAKLKLFKKVKVAIVNLDMESPEDFLQYDNKKKLVYTCHPELVSGSKLDSGSKSGMTVIKAEEIELGINYSKFKIQNLPAGRQGSKFIINLPGEFNIENALAAVSVGVSEDIPLEVCARALQKIQGVPGRMEYIENDRGLNIIVDFALTPNALEKLYALLSKIKKPEAKIFAVFGACGERDRGKRPIIGEIASRYADVIILTDDEPYRENPQQIINEIAAGVKNKEKNKKLYLIHDRREAIKKALQAARPDDIIAVTGMGNFEEMAVGGKKIPWNDKKVIQELLQATK